MLLLPGFVNEGRNKLIISRAIVVRIAWGLHVRMGQVAFGNEIAQRGVRLKTLICAWN